jgi:hypothetical protein
MMSRCALGFSTGLLLCALLSVTSAVPVWSRGARATTPYTAAQGTISGGRYRLSSTSPAMRLPPGRRPTDQEAPANVDLAGRVAPTSAWRATGAANGGKYRLAGLMEDRSPEDAWQVGGGASGGSYSLVSTVSTELEGSGCCCTYLPFVGCEY